MKIKRFKPSSILLLPQIYSITICSGLKMHLLLNLSLIFLLLCRQFSELLIDFLCEVVALLNTVLNISLHGLCLDIQLAQCNSQILIQNPLHVIIFSLNLLFLSCSLALWNKKAYLIRYIRGICYIWIIAFIVLSDINANFTNLHWSQIVLMTASSFGKPECLFVSSGAPDVLLACPWVRYFKGQNQVKNTFNKEQIINELNRYLS